MSGLSPRPVRLNGNRSQIRAGEDGEGRERWIGVAKRRKNRPMVNIYTSQRSPPPIDDHPSPRRLVVSKGTMTNTVVTRHSSNAMKKINCNHSGDRGHLKAFTILILVIFVRWPPVSQMTLAHQDAVQRLGPRRTVGDCCSLRSTVARQRRKSFGGHYIIVLNNGRKVEGAIA